MREIKFRVWMNGRFAYWGFVKDAAGSLIFAGLMQSNTCPLTMEEQQERSEQYTGIHDKNGKEIYEGDLLQITAIDEDSSSGKTFKEIYIVIWKNQYYGFALYDGKYHVLGEWDGIYAFNYLNVNSIESIEVIGNIHENPELMERK
jgi:uncharacterized phage protein (TIGR01671 family)